MRPLLGFPILAELLKIEEYLLCLLLSSIEDILAFFETSNFIPGFITGSTFILVS
jgi:hypothetical protein